MNLFTTTIRDSLSNKAIVIDEYLLHKFAPNKYYFDKDYNEFYELIDGKYVPLTKLRLDKTRKMYVNMIDVDGYCERVFCTKIKRMIHKN